MFNKVNNLISLKRSLKILSSALITTLIIFGVYGAFASAKDYTFDNPDLGFYGVKLQYHVDMNNYFNNKIKLFLKTKPDDLKNYAIPANLDKNKDQCLKDEYKNNVSTYCVAMGALNLYEIYSETLDQIAPKLLESQSKTNVAVIGTVPGTLSSLFAEFDTTKSKVAEEKANAMKVLDMTVSAYNEFRLAYPLHLKYELITKELYTYVDNLKKLRNSLSSFPAKFINSSSQSCK